MGALALCYRPLGDYMAARPHAPRSTCGSSAGSTGSIGVDPDADQRWPAYLRGRCSRSPLVSRAVPLRCCSGCRTTCCSRLGFPAVRPAPGVEHRDLVRHQHQLAVLLRRVDDGPPVQMAGLAVQNFVSAAVGIAVAVGADPRLRPQPYRPGRQLLGGPDPGRACGILLPLSVVFAIVLVAGGVIQNFHGFARRHHAGRRPRRRIPGGPVASQEAIKELGTNGGGFFNANSAHPFENPTGFTNWLRDLPAAGDPVLAAAHLRQDGRRPPAGLRDRRRRWASSGPARRSLHDARSSRSTAASALQAAGARDGGQGGPASASPASSLFAVVDDADLDRCGELVRTTRFTAARRRHRDLRHDARRDRARRYRLRPVRHADPGRSSRCSSPV